MHDTIGDAIRREREAADLTRNALAVQAGIDPSYLMRLERGDMTSPSFTAVCALADALGVSVDSLRGAEKISKKRGKKTV